MKIRSNNPGTQERIPGIARIFPTISCQYAAKKSINNEIYFSNFFNSYKYSGNK